MQKTTDRNSAVHSQLLYGAEIWTKAMDTLDLRRKIKGVQRRSVLRVISAYRTVSDTAALVLASTPPIELLTKERQEIYLENRDVTNQNSRSEIKRGARERLVRRWQEKWDTDTAGRWTHELIPHLGKWINRSHGQMDFYMTQAFSGHGCFNEYLTRFKKREDDRCLHCRHTPDNARHTIFECTATLKEREDLERELGSNITVENLVEYMLKTEENWINVMRYITHTMKRKRKMEQEEEQNRREAQLLNP